MTAAGRLAFRPSPLRPGGLDLSGQASRSRRPPPEALVCHRPGGGARSRAGVSTNQVISPATTAGPAACPGISVQDQQATARRPSRRGSAGGRAAVPDAGRDQRGGPEQADAGAAGGGAVAGAGTCAGRGGRGRRRPRCVPRGSGAGRRRWRRRCTRRRRRRRARSGWVAVAMARQAARTCSIGQVRGGLGGRAPRTGRRHGGASGSEHVIEPGRSPAAVSSARAGRVDDDLGGRGGVGRR